MSSPRSLVDSTTIRLGVGADRNASIAAATPPMFTFTCAFAILRSAAACSTTCAIAGLSQKAWIEILGICAI